MSHSEKFKNSDAYRHCLNMLNHNFQNTNSNFIDPEVALNKLSEQEIEDIYQFGENKTKKIKDFLKDKTENFKRVSAQIYFEFLLSSLVDPIPELVNLNEEIFDGIEYFKTHCLSGFTMPQFKEILRSPFRTKEGKIDWGKFYEPYIRTLSRGDIADDLFVEVSCLTAEPFQQGKIKKEEATLCLEYHKRGVLVEHFVNKPLWLKNSMWQGNKGSFTYFYRRFLDNNPDIDGGQIGSELNKIVDDYKGRSYFQMDLLSEAYHLGLRYDDIKDLSYEDLGRISSGGIVSLMQRKGCSFQEAYNETEGLSREEISVYVNLEQYGLEKEILDNSLFHKRFFLGSSETNFFKSILKSILEFILPHSFMHETLSWPEKELTSTHSELVTMASKIVDSNNNMPDFNNVISWVETIDEEQAKYCIDCMKHVTKSLLYRADQLEVLKQHEDAILPEEQWRGRPAIIEHLQPLSQPSITLRIENNQSGGRVISSVPLDFETCTPIQNFVLACGSNYGLTLDLIKDLSPVDACEYASAFLGYRMEQPGKSHSIILPGLNYENTLTKMNNPEFNLHEKRVLGQLTHCGLKEERLLQSPLHAQKENKQNTFSFRHAQNILCMFHHTNRPSKIEDILNEVEHQGPSAPEYGI